MKHTPYKEKTGRLTPVDKGRGVRSRNARGWGNCCKIKRYETIYVIVTLSSLFIDILFSEHGVKCFLDIRFI